MAGGKKNGLVIGIVIAVVALLGVGGALVATGKIPLLAKKSTKPPALYGEGKEPALSNLNGAEAAQSSKGGSEPEQTLADAGTQPAAKPRGTEAAPSQELDPTKGAKKVANVWNNMETAQLARVAKEYPEKELPLVISRMDPEKAAELLSALDPKLSALMSKELFKIGALPPKEESSQ